MIFTIDENLENTDVLNPIQEEDPLESESYTSNIDNKDNDEEDTKCQFPDTQIKIDLSGPK